MYILRDKEQISIEIVTKEFDLAFITAVLALLRHHTRQKPIKHLILHPLYLKPDILLTIVINIDLTLPIQIKVHHRLLPTLRLQLNTGIPIKRIVFLPLKPNLVIPFPQPKHRHTNARIQLILRLTCFPLVFLGDCDEAVGEGLAGYEVFEVLLLGERGAVEIGGADEVYGGHLELFVEEVPEGHPEHAVLGEIVAELFAELGGPF